MVFYVFYIIAEVPSNLILKSVGTRWLSIVRGFSLRTLLRAVDPDADDLRPQLAVGFGAVTIGSAWVQNFGDFLAVRIFLGIFEGGGQLKLCLTRAQELWTDTSCDRQSFPVSLSS